MELDQSQGHLERTGDEILTVYKSTSGLHARAQDYQVKGCALLVYMMVTPCKYHTRVSLDD